MCKSYRKCVGVKFFFDDCWSLDNDPRCYTVICFGKCPERVRVTFEWFGFDSWALQIRVTFYSGVPIFTQLFQAFSLCI